MSKYATLGQGFNLQVLLANNTDWESLDGNQLQRIIDQPAIMGAEFTAFLKNGARMPITLSEPTILEIDYTLDLAAMIALGHYDRVNRSVNAKRFSVEGADVVEYEAKLVHFNYDISSEDTVKQITEKDPTNPWQAGTIEHLLVFGAKHPEEQRKYPIVGLGSVGRLCGFRFVPCLNCHDTERVLNRSWWRGDWFACCRFLVVRKRALVLRPV